MRYYDALVPGFYLTSQQLLGAQVGLVAELRTSIRMQVMQPRLSRLGFGVARLFNDSIRSFPIRTSGIRPRKDELILTL